MKLWDARSRTQTGQSKIFEAGVVFVDFPASNEDQILTGSYDEHVRIFDRRNLKTVLKEKKLSGGVWNIEQVGSEYCTSCMYGGYSILNSDTLDIVHENRDVGSNLLYGATKMSANSVLFCTFNDYLAVLDEY
ncbi:WD_REPEATS_REGION domain-containing protein [Caenorhabditis elegans]|nr:WD_REPEATS_REGION domain-containing protein [Caenorhabditis elegans]CAM33497.3 WD_REPEATS_REGION domain-containing protein [Caenorhabditis elegans]